MSKKFISDKIETYKEEIQSEYNGEPDVIIVKPATVNKMTLEEFASKYEGNTLSIYFRNFEQKGFVRLISTDKHSLFPLKTRQDIVFDIEPIENGLITIDLNQYRWKK